MMGDGYAVVPENGEIYAPIEGEVLSVFQTKTCHWFKNDKRS